MRTNTIDLTRESHATSRRKLQHTRREHSKQQQQLAGLSVSLIHFSTAQGRDHHTLGQEDSMITALTDKPKKHVSKLGLEGTRAMYARTPRYHPQCRKAEAQTSQPKAGDEIEAGESEPEYRHPSCVEKRGRNQAVYVHHRGS